LFFSLKTTFYAIFPIFLVVQEAKTAGMPEGFAMENLGHNSKAVHRAYAKRALMKIPSLEDCEQLATEKIEPAA
jgi:hypothetical protein